MRAPIAGALSSLTGGVQLTAERTFRSRVPVGVTTDLRGSCDVLRDSAPRCPCAAVESKLFQGITGGPDTIRTCDLCLRRAALYPAELRVRRRGHHSRGRIPRARESAHAPPALPFVGPPRYARPRDRRQREEDSHERRVTPQGIED